MHGKTIKIIGECYIMWTADIVFLTERKMWGWVTKSSRMVWQEVITDLLSFYTWIVLKFQRTTIKILVCVVFRQDVCVANMDICELWMNLWIMKFQVFTAVLLKTDLQVCVLFNENPMIWHNAHYSSHCLMFWYILNQKRVHICQFCLKENFSLSVTWGHVGGVFVFN